MGKFKKKKRAQQQENQVQDRRRIEIYARKLKANEAHDYEKVKRNYSCLYEKIYESVPINHLNADEIRHRLAYSCRNIEQQFIKLRKLVCMDETNFYQRIHVTQRLLDCLGRHHQKVYEGLIFGSSVNGLGFKDSDVDLRLRTLGELAGGTLEPIECARSTVEDTLRNIAFQTTRCSPASGSFAPSARCPVAKLKFFTGDPKDLSSLEEGLNFDVSMLSSNSLGSFNSKYIRFLCSLEPKFHLLAITLRYWSKMQDLIQPGLLSSYALITMLIFFCQNTSPPLLPTVNEMSAAYFREEASARGGNSGRALIKQEWNCLISLKKEAYQPSANNEPLCLLLLKFFEFYLNFPYSSDTIISTRIGEPIIYKEFKESPLYDADFSLKPILNIQDPFDLKHNVTAGMSPKFFRRLMLSVQVSYERLFTELGKFKQPDELKKAKNGEMDEQLEPTKKDKNLISQLEDWGLNAIFV